MLERSTPQHDEQIADLQTQLAVLKQENKELRSRLQTCKKSTKQQLYAGNSDREHRLLEATATATNALLTIAPFDAAVNTALQIIGEALNTDRVVLIETVAPPPNSTFPGWRALGYEWNSSGTVPQYLDPDAAQGSYEEIPEIFELLHQGQPLSFLIEDTSEPFRSTQMAIGVKAMHTVPIFIEGQWWGVIGFDDCREAKRRSAAELSALKIAADCIGSAIQRDRTQKAILQAEQDRAAELAKVNEALHNAIVGLAQLDNLDQFLAELLRVSLEVSGAHGGAVCLIQGEFVRHAVLFDKAGLVSPEVQAAQGTLLSPFTSELRVMAQRILEEDAWVVRPDEAIHPPSFQAFHREQGNCAIRLIPMRTGDRLLGWLGLGFAQEDPPLGRSFALLRALAEQMTMAVEMLRLSDEARQAAIAREQEKAAQERAAELARSNEALQQTIDTLGSLSSFAEFIPAVLEIVAQTFNATDCGYYEHSQDETVYLRYWFSHGTVLNPMELQLLDPHQHPVLLRIVNGFTVPLEHLHGTTVRDRTRPVIIDHTTANTVSEFHTFAVSQGWELELNQPLLVDGKAEGALIIYRKLTQPFTEAEITLAEALAKQLALAMQASRLADQARDQAVETAIAREQEKAAQERVAELAKANEALARTSSRLAEQPDLSSFLSHITIEAITQLGADAGHLTILNEQRHTLCTVAHVEQDRLLASDNMASEMPIAEAGFLQLLLETRKPRYFDLEQEAHLFWSGAIEYHRQRNHCAVLSVPLYAGGKFLGHLGLAFTHADPISEQASELLQALSYQAALAIQLTRLAEEAKQAAIAREQEKAAQARSQELERLNAELQQTLDRLAESEERYRTLFEISSEGIYRFEYTQPISIDLPVDEQVEMIRRYLRVAEGNATYAEMYGFDKPEDVVGLCISNAHVNNSERNQAFLQALVENKHQIRNYESEEVDRHGKPRSFLNNNITITQNGHAVGGWASQLDITELRLAQQALLEVEQARSAELERANNALQSTVAALADRRDLDGFIGEVLHTIANEFESPLVEYWTVLEADTVEINTWLHDNRLCSLKQNDEHPGCGGICLLPELYEFEDFTHRRQPFVFNEPMPAYSLALGQVICPTEWYAERGVSKHFNFSLQAGNTTVGAITVWLPLDRQITEECLRLGQALSHQTALAIQLTQLVEEAKQVAIAREQEKAAQERAAELVKANEALARASSRLTEQPDLTAFLGHIMLEATSHLGANASHLMLFNKQRETFSTAVLVERGYVISSPPLAMELSIDEVRLHPVMQETGKLRYFDLEKERHLFWDGSHEYHYLHNHRSVMVVPLNAGGEFLGYLGLAFTDYEPIGEQETELLQALCHQAALAIQLTQLAEEAKQAAIAREQEKAAQERAVELTKANEALRRSVERVASDMCLETLVSAFLIEAINTVGADAAAVMLRIPDSLKFTPAAVVEDGRLLSAKELASDPYLSRYVEFSATDVDGIFSTLARGETPSIRVDNLREVFPEAYTYHQQLGHRIIWHTPLRLQGKVIGFTGIALRENRLPSHAVRETVTALAQQLTLALELTRLAEESKQAAIAREQEKAAQERVAELVKANNALRRSVCHLTTTDNLYRFLIATLQEAIQASDATSGAIFVYQPASDTLQATVIVLHGEVINIATDPRAELWRSPIPIDVTPFWQQLQNQEIVWTDLEQPSLQCLWQFSIAWHQQQGHQTIPMIPMAIGEQVLGFVGLAFTTQQTPTEFRFEQCRTFAHHAALALQMADLMQQAKQTAILEERNRMARDIHDTLAQSFTGIIMQLEGTKNLPNANCPDIQTSLECIGELARLGLTEARRSVRALRLEALEITDFPTALHRLLHQTTNGTSIQATLAIEGTVQPLSPICEENLLRIAQEAITNAIRHGQAQTIALQLLFEPSTVHLHISDDGDGFDPQHITLSGFGLLGMQERVNQLHGQFHLVSQPGQGTAITVSVPI